MEEGKKEKKKGTDMVNYPVENMVLPHFRRKVEGVANPSETNCYASLSLSLVTGLVSIQDFYLSGNMYQESCIFGWYPIPSHPLLCLSLSHSHHLHHTTASFPYTSLRFFSRLK